MTSLLSHVYKYTYLNVSLFSKLLFFPCFILVVGLMLGPCFLLCPLLCIVFIVFVLKCVAYYVPRNTKYDTGCKVS